MGAKSSKPHLIEAEKQPLKPGEVELPGPWRAWGGQRSFRGLCSERIQRLLPPMPRLLSESFYGADRAFSDAYEPAHAMQDSCDDTRASRNALTRARLAKPPGPYRGRIHEGRPHGQGRYYGEGVFAGYSYR